MPDVRLRRETSHELHFEHPRWPSWAVAAAVAGFWTLFRHVGAGLDLELLHLICGILLAGSLLSSLWCNELTLDLATRSYRSRRGFWPAPRIFRGSFDELEGVALSQSWLSQTEDGGSRSHPVWHLHLTFRPPKRSIHIATVLSEAPAHARLEHFARALGVAAIDRTGDAEHGASPDGPDRRASEGAPPETATGPIVGSTDGPSRKAGPVSLIATVGPPPAGTGIHISGAAGREAISLPPPTRRSRVVAASLLGLPFASLGALVFLAATDLLPLNHTGPPIVGIVMGIIIILCGAALPVVTLLRARGRQKIERRGNYLCFSTEIFGRQFRRRLLHRRSIADLAVRRSITTTRGDRHQLFLRTDQQIVRLGHHLEPRGLEWLHEAVRIMLRD